MALFGGIGKKLGLGSARDVLGEGIGGLVEDVGDFTNQLLPTIGAVAGFALGGPGVRPLVLALEPLHKVAEAQKIS